MTDRLGSAAAALTLCCLRRMMLVVLLLQDLGAAAAATASVCPVECLCLSQIQVGEYSNAKSNEERYSSDRETRARKEKSLAMFAPWIYHARDPLLYVVCIARQTERVMKSIFGGQTGVLGMPHDSNARTAMVFQEFCNHLSLLL